MVCCSCCCKKRKKSSRFETIPQTRAYVRRQRWYLYLHLFYNIMLPYWTLVVPLFVMAGPQAGGLEIYFVIALSFVAHIFWSFLCRTATSYPEDIAQGHSYHDKTATELSISKETIKILSEAGRRKSTPSLLRVLCLSECWKELLLGKLLTCTLLLAYGLVILYTYIELGIACKFQGMNVSISTAITMYVTFFISLYYTFQYDGPFHRALVTNDRNSPDFYVLLKIFSTRFPDDLFPLHLSFGDCFRPSADVISDLHKLAAVTSYFKGSNMDIFAHLCELSNDENQSSEKNHDVEDKSIIGLSRTSLTSLRSRSLNSNMSTKSNEISVKSLLEDDRFSDSNWDFLSESCLSPEAQVDFLNMLQTYLNEGITRHIGAFLEQHKIEACRLANMLATVDEHATCIDTCAKCQVLCYARGLCCCCAFCCREKHDEVSKAWKDVDEDVELGSHCIVTADCKPTVAESIER